MNDKPLSLSILAPPLAVPTQDVAKILQRWHQSFTLRVLSGELGANTEQTYQNVTLSLAHRPVSHSAP